MQIVMLTHWQIRPSAQTVVLVHTHTVMLVPLESAAVIKLVLHTTRVDIHIPPVQQLLHIQVIAHSVKVV